MSTLDAELSRRLDDVKAQGLYRELRCVDSAQGPRIQIDGRSLINFSSNDYLGLANDPLMKRAASEGVDRFGAGAGSSRLVCGSLSPYHQLEETIAAFKRTEAALSFSTGYAAALGTICALMGSDDIVILDKLSHACLVDAARSCGAKLRVFAHNDLAALEKILRWATDQRMAASATAPRPVQILVVTESVFSMDGDQAPLREIVRLKDQYGAWLMVDEAHATGLYGAGLRGLAEQFGVSEGIEIQMGTLGKALGASGGYICGSRVLIDYLINRARSFIFSTAPVPAAAAAATAGFHFLQSEAGKERVATLWNRVTRFTGAIDSPPSLVKSAIIPLLVGAETRALELAALLKDRGIFIPAIRYPTVARGQARLRLTLTAAHATADVDALLAALAELQLNLRAVEDRPGFYLS